MTEDAPAAPKRRSPLFDFTFNLGHVFIVVSFLASGAMFYVDKVSHTAVTDSKIETLDAANLPARVQVLEMTTTNLRSWMERQTNLLTQIRDRLDTKADKPK